MLSFVVGQLVHSGAGVASSKDTALLRRFSFDSPPPL